MQRRRAEQKMLSETENGKQPENIEIEEISNPETEVRVQRCLNLLAFLWIFF